MSDFNAKIIEEFRRNAGQVGGWLQDTPVLLLHHTGARSGSERLTPLAYLPDGERYIVVASNAGSPRSPGWYHNLKAHPNVAIEVGTQRIDVVAHEATGAERERLYGLQVERYPQVAEHASKTERAIAVIVLTSRPRPTHPPGSPPNQRQARR